MSLREEKREQERLAREAGVKIERHPGVRGMDQAEVDRFASTVIGVLAGASTQDVRRRALDKARRMLGVR